MHIVWTAIVPLLWHSMHVVLSLLATAVWHGMHVLCSLLACLLACLPALGLLARGIPTCVKFTFTA
jgi:hypothetical protein